MDFDGFCESNGGESRHLVERNREYQYAVTIHGDFTKPEPECSFKCWDVNNTPADYDDVAEAAARDFYDNHLCDSSIQQSDWPVIVTLFDEGDNTLGRFSVYLDDSPTFAAYPLKKSSYTEE